MRFSFGVLINFKSVLTGITLREEFFLPALKIAPGIFYGTEVKSPHPVLARLGFFYTYADLSQVKNISSYTGLPDTSVLESIGPDLRINGGRNFSLRFELGWRLRRLPYGSYGKGLFEDIEAAIMF